MVTSASGFEQRLQIEQRAGGEAASRSPRSLSYNDHLLNDWGIHHLHLGTNLEADGFVNRTGALLYVVFRDTLDVYGEGNTDAHLIGVMSHNDFATQELLEITHANWPRLMQFGSVVGLKGDRLSDDQISVLRSRRLNYCLLLRDGKAYLPPGGGVTLSGASTLDQMRGLHRVWWAEQQQEMVLSQMPGIIEREMTPPPRTFPRSDRSRVPRGSRFAAQPNQGRQDGIATLIRVTIIPDAESGRS